MLAEEKTTKKEKLIDFINSLTAEECNIIINALKKEQP